MTNPILLKSSLILGMIHLITIFIVNYTKEYNEHRQLLIYNVLAGIFTSILNHSTTSIISKWLDRGMMVIGIYNDIYLITFIPNPNPTNVYHNMNQLFSYYFLSLSILSFLFSKRISKTKHEFDSNPFLLQMSFHITSHILLTITHIIMFIYLI